MAYLEGLPLPAPSMDDAGFWEGIKRQELVIQRCTKCDTFRHTPTPVCYNCHSFDFEWAKVSGNGTVFSYVIAHHPPAPSLKDKVPYNVVVVELEGTGGCRMVSNVIDCPLEEIHVGMPVKIVFEKMSEEAILPRFVRA